MSAGVLRRLIVAVEWLRFVRSWSAGGTDVSGACGCLMLEVGFWGSLFGG